MESQRTRGRVSVCLHRSRLWRSALCPGWWLFRSLPWPRWDPARPLCPKPLLSSTLLAQHSNGCSRDTTSTHANCSGGLCLQASWQSLHTDREGDCPALFHLCSSHFVFKGGQTARGRDVQGSTRVMCVRRNSLYKVKRGGMLSQQRLKLVWRLYW